VRLSKDTKYGCSRLNMALMVNGKAMDLKLDITVHSGPDMEALKRGLGIAPVHTEMQTPTDYARCCGNGTVAVEPFEHLIANKMHPEFLHGNSFSRPQDLHDLMAFGDAVQGGRPMNADLAARILTVHYGESILADRRQGLMKRDGDGNEDSWSIAALRAIASGAAMPGTADNPSAAVRAAWNDYETHRPGGPAFLGTTPFAGTIEAVEHEAVEHEAAEGRPLPEHSRLRASRRGGGAAQKPHGLLAASTARQTPTRVGNEVLT
jgi:hypothetical protein